MKFVRTKRYLKDLKRLGATDDEAEAIEQEIASDPTIGDVIKGLGVRKLRFALGSKGKRGGGRAIYFLMLADDTTLMLTAYGKNEQADLSPEQRKAILVLVREINDG